MGCLVFQDRIDTWINGMDQKGLGVDRYQDRSRRTLSLDGDNFGIYQPVYIAFGFCFSFQTIEEQVFYTSLKSVRLIQPDHYIQGAKK